MSQSYIVVFNRRELILTFIELLQGDGEHNRQLLVNIHTSGFTDNQSRKVYNTKLLTKNEEFRQKHYKLIDGDGTSLPNSTFKNCIISASGNNLIEDINTLKVPSNYTHHKGHSVNDINTELILRISTFIDVKLKDY